MLSELHKWSNKLILQKKKCCVYKSWKYTKFFFTVHRELPELVLDFYCKIQYQTFGGICKMLQDFSLTKSFRKGVPFYYLQLFKRSFVGGLTKDVNHIIYRILLHNHQCATLWACATRSENQNFLSKIPIVP